MSEEKLQSDIVRRFSELYPYKKGQLFHVANERAHQLQAFKAKSIGIVGGVSDLIYVCIFGIKCLEIKSYGSRHSISHLIRQVEWGKTIEEVGHQWRLIRTTQEAIHFINGASYKVGLTTKEVEQLIEENGNKKTIKF